jgi:hypothetical protein
MEVHILGVNGIGHESGNADTYAGRTTPWLQDVLGVDVWTAWAVTYRDVLILDENNVVVGVYNLTSNDLGIPDNYNALRGLLVSAATP